MSVREVKGEPGDRCGESGEGDVVSGGSSGEEGSGEGHFYDKRESHEYPGGSGRDNGEGSGVVSSAKVRGVWGRRGGKGEEGYEKEEEHVRRTVLEWNAI